MTTLTQFTGGRNVASINNRWSAGGTALINGLPSILNAKSYASSSVAANALQTMLNVSSGRGVLNFVAAFVNNTTSRTVRIKITVDGVVIFDATSSATTTANDGMCALGSFGQTSYPIQTFESVQFTTSCLVEIASSVLNDSTNITTYINYELDA